MAAAVHPLPNLSTEADSTTAQWESRQKRHAKEEEQQLPSKWQTATNRILAYSTGVHMIRGSETETLYGKSKNYGEQLLREYENRHSWQKGTILWDSNKMTEKWWQRVLHPYHPARSAWDLAQVLALLYVSFIVPYRVGFNHHPEEIPFEVAWWIELAVDVYFTLDIVFNFRTGYFTIDGTVECRRGRVANYYCKSYLLLDIVSCLPVSYIAQLSNPASNQAGSSTVDNPPEVKSVKFIRLLRLGKLLRLVRLSTVIKRHEENLEGIIGPFKLLGCGIIIAYIAHLIACSWYYVGEDETLHLWNETSQQYDRLETIAGWVSTEFGDPGMVEHTPRSRRYLVAYYWALTTISTVGYGDISPATSWERWTAMMSQLMGCFAFASLIGFLGSMLVGQRLLEQKVQQQLRELREFLKLKNIPEDLSKRIKRHMENMLSHSSGYNESEMLDQLPPAMSQDLLDALYREMVLSVPLFRNLEEGAITAVMKRLRPFRAVAGDRIFQVGEQAREVFVVISGTVELRHKCFRGVELIPPSYHTSGSVVGESVIDGLLRSAKFQKRTPSIREATARAVEDCDLKFLTKESLSEIAQDFPSFLVEVDRIATKRKQHSDELLKPHMACVRIQSGYRSWRARKETRENANRRTKDVLKRSSTRMMEHSHAAEVAVPSENTEHTSVDADVADLRKQMATMQHKLDTIIQMMHNQQPGVAGGRKELPPLRE